METKIVYFVVSGKEEQAEFSKDALSEDIKGTIQYSKFFITTSSTLAMTNILNLLSDMTFCRVSTSVRELC